MRSTFSGLEIGTRALQAHQKALEVTSHNMANAGTAGYSRQTAAITATDPFTYPSFSRVNAAGQVGTGVEITSIMRVRDGLIDQQIQQETSNLGYWETRQDMLGEMEIAFNEPSDTGIRAAVDEFWKSLQELSLRPQEQSVRSAVRQQAVALTDQIKQNYTQLNTLKQNADAQIQVQVAEINKYANQIAELNDQIGKLTVLGDNPNDLLDKRDAVVESLSKLVNITQVNDAENRVNITISGRMLVAGEHAEALEARQNTENSGMVDLYWKGTNYPVEVKNGKLQGLLEIRDQDLTSMINNLNDYASALITEMNAVHQQGYDLEGNTGLDFFSGTNASNIGIAAEVAADLNRIAASETGAVGNGGIALKMANIKQKQILSDGQATMGDFISGLISKLGVDSGIAQTKTDNQTLLIGHLDTRRESISGVSLDEEMANMLKFQHGYTAAAKIITTMDEMLDVIINRLKV